MKQCPHFQRYQVSASPAASAESFGHSADQALASLVDVWDRITLFKIFLVYLLPECGICAELCFVSQCSVRWLVTDLHRRGQLSFLFFIEIEITVW